MREGVVIIDMLKFDHRGRRIDDLDGELVSLGEVCGSMEKAMYVKDTILRKMAELRKDENRLSPWKWPDDPSWEGKILYAKDATSAGRANWIRLKIAKALEWEDALARMGGFKKDTDPKSPTYGKYTVRTAGAEYDLKGYSCSDGSTVDLDDRTALLQKAGQNIWKDIPMKLAGRA